MAARKASEPAPPAQIASLERALAGEAPLSRGYLVRGEERWFREAAVAILVGAAARRGLEVVRYDGADPDVDLAAMQGDLSAQPMFASARLVLARNVPLLVDRKGSAGAAILAALESFLRRSAVPGCLVLEADSLRVDHALAKAVSASGGTVLSLRRLYDSPPPWDRDADPRRTELVQWLLGRAREKGLRLDPGEALFVATATGNDLGALDAALGALARRGERDLRESVAWTGAVSPFQLAEDLLHGDLAASLAGVEALFRSGMRAKDGSREVKPEAALAVLFASLRSKLREALARSRADASSRGAETWRAMQDDLAQLERKTRTSRTLDANDLALLALRWRREDGRIPTGGVKR